VDRQWTPASPREYVENWYTARLNSNIKVGSYFKKRGRAGALQPIPEAIQESLKVEC